MKPIFLSSPRNRRHRQAQPEKQQNEQQSFFAGSGQNRLQRKPQPFFQPKYAPAEAGSGVAVGKAGDHYEREADAVADAVVNHNAGQQPVVQKQPITPLGGAGSLQRLATPDEEKMPATNDARMEKDKAIQEKPIQKMGEPGKEEEKPVQAMDEPGKEEENPVQAMDEPGKEEEKPVQAMDEPGKEEEKPVQAMGEPGKEEEEEPVQAKSEPGVRPTAPNLGNRLSQKEGNGTPLPKNIKSEMENSFGVDFSGVNIHTDSEAIQMNRDLQAQAFTHGRDVYFNSGKFNPEQTEGKRLLAHELTHVVQQDSVQQIRRKIEVAGKAYTPTKKYKDWLKNNYGNTALTILEQLHNSGNPPDHKFDSYDSMGLEIRVRAAAVKGMKLTENGCCNYPSTEPNGYLDPVYWKRNGWMDFSAKSPLPAGKKASDAIKAIFAPGAGTQLECMAMTTAVEYYSLLEGLGSEKFDNMFPGGVGLVISTRSSPREHMRVHKTNKYEFITAKKSELLPGDWVYFKNFSDYTTKHPGGFWRGENAIVYGPDKFGGFGANDLTESQMLDELVKAYNDGLPAAAKKTKANLIAQGGGLLDSPVIRPKISEILK